MKAPGIYAKITSNLQRVTTEGGLAIVLGILSCIIMQLILEGGKPFAITLLPTIAIVGVLTLLVGLVYIFTGEAKSYDSGSLFFQIFLTSCSSAFFGATFSGFAEIGDPEVAKGSSLSLIGFTIASLAGALSLLDTIHESSQSADKDIVEATEIWSRIASWLPVLILTAVFPAVIANFSSEGMASLFDWLARD